MTAKIASAQKIGRCAMCGVIAPLAVELCPDCGKKEIERILAEKETVTDTPYNGDPIVGVIWHGAPLWFHEAVN